MNFDLIQGFGRDARHPGRDQALSPAICATGMAAVSAGCLRPDGAPRQCPDPPLRTQRLIAAQRVWPRTCFGPRPRGQSDAGVQSSGGPAETGGHAQVAANVIPARLTDGVQRLLRHHLWLVRSKPGDELRRRSVRLRRVPRCWLRRKLATRCSIGNACSVPMMRH